jgi:transcriptional regulator with XRE-family HTH domain
VHDDYSLPACQSGFATNPLNICTNITETPVTPLFTAQVESFAHLVSRLRRERGLTQADLADAAGCDQETIAKVEQGRARQWRPRTAHRVYEALSAVSPLSAEDAAAYTRSTKITPRAMPGAMPRATAHSPEIDRQRLHRLLDLIIQAIGVQPVAAALVALGAAYRVEEKLASQPHTGAGAAGADTREFVVRHPPVQHEGYTEQVERLYESITPPAPARPRARRSAP